MKEAVVFIIDTSPSMNTPYPRTNHGSKDDPNKSSTTRLECAKQVVLSMISDLILKSKTNEVSVILCKTLETKHHKIASSTDFQETGDDLPFPHLVELTPGIVRPTPALLRQIINIQPSIIPPDDDKASAMSTLQHNGDLCDAIILATDAFYERGTKYKFQRKMILLTDAEHTLVMDVKSTLTIIDELRNMECQMEVFGFDFTSSATYTEPMVVDSMACMPSDVSSSSMPNKKMKTIPEEDTGNSSSTTSDVMDQIVYATKYDREQLLLSLTEKTGGAVIAVSTLQEILNAQQGRRIQNSVQTKFEFRMAPKISFEARFFLMMSKQSFPKLITKAVKTTDDPSRVATSTDTGEGEEPEVTFNVQRAELFVDPDEPDDIVADEDRTKAIYFGSTLIPMSSFDYEGLKPSQMGARLEVLGYMPRSKIPLEYLSGPPSGISGHESPKACAAISAMANALHRLDKVAIGTFYKRSTSTKPLLVIVFPYTDPESSFLETSLQSLYLAILQIPFGGETKKIDLDCFDEYLDVDAEGNAAEDEKTKACDDLIASLMLPEHVLSSGHVPSPLIRSCNQTKIQRAIDPNAEIVCVRTYDELDPMITPPDVLQTAESAIQAFETVFDFDHVIAKMDATPEKSKNHTTGRKVLTYKDFL
jgi:hypothetical protein